MGGATFNATDGSWTGDAALAMTFAVGNALQSALLNTVGLCWQIGEEINYYAMLRIQQEARVVAARLRMVDTALATLYPEQGAGTGAAEGPAGPGEGPAATDEGPAAIDQRSAGPGEGPAATGKPEISEADTQELAELRQQQGAAWTRHQEPHVGLGARRGH
jgi:hypothetical protein